MQRLVRLMRAEVTNNVSSPCHRAAGGGARHRGRIIGRCAGQAGSGSGVRRRNGPQRQPSASVTRRPGWQRRAFCKDPGRTERASGGSSAWVTRRRVSGSQKCRVVPSGLKARPLGAAISPTCGAARRLGRAESRALPVSCDSSSRPRTDGSRSAHHSAGCRVVASIGCRCERRSGGSKQAGRWQVRPAATCTWIATALMGSGIFQLGSSRS